MQRPDLGRTEAEYVGEDGLGVLPEARSRGRLDRKFAVERDGRPGREIGADVRLVDVAEEFALDRDPWVVVNEFLERLVPAPADPEIVEASSDLIDAVSSDPRSNGGGDRLPVSEAFALIAETDPMLGLDRGDGCRGVRCL